jgi:hypothetical protein
MSVLKFNQWQSVNGTVYNSIVNVTSFQSNTQITTSASANVTYFTFNVTKKATNSILLAHGTIPIGGSTNHGIYWFVSFANNRVFRGIGDGWRYHGGDVAQNSIPGALHLNVASPTGIAAGTVEVGFGIQPIDGSSNRPYHVINPNTSTDGRNNCGTNIIVYEVLQ